MCKDIHNFSETLFINEKLEVVKCHKVEYISSCGIPNIIKQEEDMIFKKSKHSCDPPSTWWPAVMSSSQAGSDVSECHYMQ